MFIDTEEQLVEIAGMMAADAKRYQGDAVFRYQRLSTEAMLFVDGRAMPNQHTQALASKELMDSMVYSTNSLMSSLRPSNYADFTVSRDLQEQRYSFQRKHIPLPVEQVCHFEQLPAGVDMHDEELRSFSENHENAIVQRTYGVFQQVVVNTKGGVAIQSIPSFSIKYFQGFEPIPTSRTLGIVCNTEEDVRQVPSLVKYLADPTPQRRIRNSNSLYEAFDNLHSLYPLRFGSLKDAGVPISELYDVVMLTGTPVHEIFGHHFELPIRMLDFGESGTFLNGLETSNKTIVMADNPKATVDGLRVRGFHHFDAYGRPRGRVEHIKDGQVKEFLGGEYSDKEKMKHYLGLSDVDFSGSSVAGMDGFFPQPRMSCTTLEGPSEDIDLEGKIVIVSNNGHTNPQDKSYKCEAQEAYVIRDGEPHRVLPLAVSGGIMQALAGIKLLPDVTLNSGSCGKAEPLHYPQPWGKSEAPVSMLCQNQIWTGQQVYNAPIRDVHLKILCKSPQPL